MTPQEKLIIEAVVEMLSSTLGTMSNAEADSIVAKSAKILKSTFL